MPKIGKFYFGFPRREKSYLGSGTDSLLLKRLIGADWDETKFLESYSKSLYVFACVSRIAEKVGETAFTLNRIQNLVGDTEEIFNHPVLDLLYRVNPFQTKSEFLEILVSNFLLSGNSFIWKLRNEKGEVAELWNLRPDKMTIVADPEIFIKEYIFTKDDGTQEHFEPNDIIHFKIPSPLDIYRGVSPLASAQIRVQTEEYATKHQRDLFLNNARPDALIMSDRTLTQKQKDELQARWEQRHKGVGKSSRIGLLEGGLKYQQLSLTPIQIDHIESMKFTRDDILTAFKMPKPILAVIDDVNRANSETAKEIFLSETIKPLVAKITEKLNEQLITPEYGEEYNLGFKDPTPQNKEMLLKEFQAGIDNWLTANEIRQQLGKEPIRGGDNLLRPLTLSPIGSSIINPPTQDNKKRILFGRKSLRARFNLERMIRGEAKKIKEQLKKKIKKSGSLFFTKEKRQQYLEYKNRIINRRTAKFKGKINKIANEQADRFIKTLKKLKKDEIKKLGKREIRKLFDTKEENRIFSEAVLGYYLKVFEDEANDALAMIRVGQRIDMTKAFKEKAAPEKTILERLRERATFFAKTTNNTTLNDLSNTLAEGIEGGEGMEKLTERIAGVYSGFNDYRAERIARTETMAVSNDADIEAFRQSEVINGKEWISTTNPCDECDIDGEIVGLDDSFSNGEDEPPVHPNCGCVIGPGMIWV